MSLPQSNIELAHHHRPQIMKAKVMMMLMIARMCISLVIPRSLSPQLALSLPSLSFVPLSLLKGVFKTSSPLQGDRSHLQTIATRIHDKPLQLQYPRGPPYKNRDDVDDKSEEDDDDNDDAENDDDDADDDCVRVGAM